MNETNLSEVVASTPPVSEPKRKKRGRKVRPKPKRARKRYMMYLDPDIQEESKQRVKDGYAPDPHLSQLVSRLLDNWNNGHYDDAHEKLGWFDGHGD